MTQRYGKAAAMAGLLLAATVSGCMTDGKGFSSYASNLVADKVDPAPLPSAFHYCHSHGCEDRSLLSLTGAQWRDATWRLIPEPGSAAEERQRLAWAVADFETVVAAETGTESDVGGSFAGFGRSGQLDCVDESLNMTMFLRMLEGQGLLRFHRPSQPVTKGTLIDGWPHYSATMIELASGQHYTLDSWYFDNGEPALVPRRETWLSKLEDLITCMRDGAEDAQVRKSPAECGYS